MDGIAAPAVQSCGRISKTEMLLIIVALATILVVVLARYFVLNAIALRRDLDRRFEDFRVRLERDANSTLQDLLDTKTSDDSSR